ncbi:hypothetical protein E2C01_072419 [Portunus trituberculatus]|uniref:Uncharacterized protein n=1 Tax=Portunus trituberculatus TaxID=210409 RepID=A0A5B7HZT9_PORTR|nr:hypothetical protein [Portunus trituberculatus]
MNSLSPVLREIFTLAHTAAPPLCLPTLSVTPQPVPNPTHSLTSLSTSLTCLLRIALGL